ncbi:MAG: CBS domain-containing protein [Alphaproteobacteria bacterium]|nr:CBS domain-containing protein [Alphaproteobacteria bacterium]MBT4083574.1 CBS domain-containing protein [Alphaproteobacteria bacterium]MBT4545378.1 CBS domain-containing protein [Alphaproteobacteria bacterium]
MKVENILTVKGAEIVKVTTSDSVHKTAKLLREMRIGAVLVSDDTVDPAGIAGIISERDIIGGLAVHGAAALDMSVDTMMTRDVHVCGPSDTVDDVMSMMTDKRIRHLPVMENNELVGLISIGDVVKNKIAESEEEARALRDYITTAG